MTDYQAIVKGIVGIQGVTALVAEIERRERVEMVDALTRSLVGVDKPKIPRIKAARILYHMGLRDARDWVEDNFHDLGKGEPIL